MSTCHLLHVTDYVLVFASFPSLSPGIRFMENVHVHTRPVREPHGGSPIPNVLFQSEYSSSSHSFPALHFTNTCSSNIWILGLQITRELVWLSISISISHKELAPKGNLPKVDDLMYEKTRARPWSKSSFLSALPCSLPHGNSVHPL